MRWLYLLVGIIAAVFLIPMFKHIWDGMVPTLTAGITDPWVLLFFVIVPYAVPAAVVVALFMVARGRKNE
jgi:hypothetical protein